MEAFGSSLILSTREYSAIARMATSTTNPAPTRQNAILQIKRRRRSSAPGNDLTFRATDMRLKKNTNFDRTYLIMPKYKLAAWLRFLSAVSLIVVFGCGSGGPFKYV